jgi:O-antigen ligase
MIRAAIVPAFLFACLLLGGASAAGFLPNLLLQLGGIGLAAWALLARREERLPAAARSLLALAGLLAAAMLLQLVPLPPAVWTLLPGRGAVADGYRLLGRPLPWLPLSLAPEATGASLLWLLPAFATLVGMVLLGAFRAAWLAWGIAAATALGVAVGALQVMGGNTSPWYFYQITNFGQAVGFFANSNHAATLLIAAVPFALALQAHGLSRDRSGRRAPAILVITGAFLVTVAVGLVINGSLAGIGLAVPVAVASLTLLGAAPGRRLMLGLGATAALMAAALAFIVLGPTQNNLTGARSDDPGLEQLTRRVSIPTTFAAAARYLPFGSGVGSFRQVYQQAEDPRATIDTFMNHAHSDLAEVVLETGLPGALLLLLLLAWWVRRVRALWRVADPPDPFARAAAIASGAILAHSLVDYPLRTAAISALFAACLALMSEVRSAARSRAGDRGARHRRIA